MKKLFAFIIVFVMLFSSVVLPVSAEEPNTATAQKVQEIDGTTVIYYDDGSTLTISAVQIAEDQISAYSTGTGEKKVAANRVATRKDSSGNLIWKYTLYGTFSYVPGVSSTCIAASYDQEICNSEWSFSDGSATASGNKANGKGVFKQKFLFITINTDNVDISLTCDIYGNVT